MINGVHFIQDRKEWFKDLVSGVSCQKNETHVISFYNLEY